jgi:hypothetical protein
MSYSENRIWSSAVLTLNGATDLEQAFVAMSRLVITKVALRVTSADAGGAVVTFERRRGVSTDTTVEVVTIPAADNDGIMLYTDVAPADQIEFLPGDILNLAVSESGTAPTAHAVVEYFVVESDLERLESATVVESA